MLIKVLLLFFYCFSSQRILLSLAPFSLEQAIKINFANKRKHSDSANEERKENKGFDFKKKSKKLDKKSDKKKSKKSSQSQKNPKKYKCDKKFAKNAALLTHKRSHTGEKPYPCNVCGRYFSIFSNLKAHKRLHSGEQPYPCDVCGRKFNGNAHLEIHKRSHTGEQPYECDKCDKKFSIFSNLNVHKKIHAGDKPYQCNVCLKRFTQKNNLKVHKTTQHNVEDISDEDLKNVEEYFDPSSQGELFPLEDSDNMSTSHSEDISDEDLKNVEKYFDPYSQGELFPLEDSDNMKHDLPQEETQAGQEAHSKRMEATSECNVYNLSEYFDPYYQGALFSFEDSANMKHDLPQEEIQAGQEANSKRMEAPSECNVHNIEKSFYPSSQGVLFSFEDSDNMKHDLPQEETQAGQEVNSTRMEAPSELSCWFCISDRTYSTTSNLNHHTRKQHTYYKCKYKNCDEAFILGSLLFQHIEKQHRFPSLPSLPCSKCPQSFYGLLNLYQHEYIKHKKYDKNTFIKFIKDFIIKNLRSFYPSDGQHPFFNSLFSKEEVLIDRLLDLERIDISEIPIETLPFYEEFIKKIISNNIPKFDKLSLDELLSYECYRLYLFDDSAIWLLFLKDILSIMIRIKNSLRNPLETTYKEMLDILYTKDTKDTKDTNQFSDEEYFLFMQTFKNLFFKKKISTGEQIKMVALNSLNKSA